MENQVPITPTNFFQLRADCFRLPPSKNHFALSSKNYKNYLLPDTSILTNENSFSKVAMGWSSEGLEIFLWIDEPYSRTLYPQLEKGDSFELCIDTRDVKTSGYNTQFCHHFFFLPELVEGVQAGEITKFRTEDAHELCDSRELKVQSTFSTHHYLLQCFIPTHCLTGYDPEQFNRLGMTYRVNRFNDSPQQFSVLASEYKFEEQPSLWASIHLAIP